MKIATRPHTLWMAGLMLVAGAAHLAAQPTAQAPAIVPPSSTLYFNHQIGASAPPPQTIRVGTTPANLPFTATSNMPWVTVNGANSATGTSNSATQEVQIAVNPASFTVAGDYPGTVTLASGSTTSTINIILRVGTAAQMRVDPNSLLLNIETGAAPTVQTLSINPTTSGQAVELVNIEVMSQVQTPWLNAARASATSASVFINPAQFPSGATSLFGLLRLTSANGSVTVPVSINVLPAAQLSVSPLVVTFPYQLGFQAPSARPVNVVSTSSTSQLLYNVTVASHTPSWLSVSTTPAGPGTLTLRDLNTGSNPVYLIANPAAIGNAPGTYEAQVRFEAPSTSSVQTVTARLVVSNQAQLITSADSAVFAYTLGGNAPAAQTINLTSTSGQLPFTATTVYTTGGEWFRIDTNSTVTPASLVIRIDPNRLPQLTAGSYTGSVRLSYGTGSTLDIPVSLTVSGSALLSVDPTSLEITSGEGVTPPQRTIIVRSTDNSDQPFTVTVEGTNAGWLVPARTSGSTGASGTLLALNINPVGRTAGTYEAFVVIRPTAVQTAPVVRVPVRYIVTGTQTISATPARIELTQIGSTVPAAQTIDITSPAGARFTVTPSASWIKVSASSDTIPARLTVTFDTANQQPAELSGTIDILVAGLQALSIPVSLRVQARPTLAVTPNTLTFNWTTGTTAPAAQTINLSSNGAAIPFTTTVSTNAASWLRVEPPSGTTGATGAAATAVRVTVVPTGLQPGRYEGTITFNATTATNASTTVTVALVASAPAMPQITTVINAATGLSRGVAPGMIITIFGRNIAPAERTAGIIRNNVFETQVGEVRVLFDDVPAPLLYVGPGGNANQINAIVPYEIGFRVTTRMVIEYRGVRSESLELRVIESDPGIFTATMSGSGQGAILNENSSVNSVNNPAARGSIIQIYATGEGTVTPAGTNGQVIMTANDLRKPVLPVRATVGGQEALVTYYGSAPTLVSGAFQVNVLVPQTLNITGPSSVPVQIQVGDNQSPQTVTVAVR